MPKIRVLPGRADRGKKPEEWVTGTVVEGKRVKAGKEATASKGTCRLLIATGKAEPASPADKKAIESKGKDDAA